MAVLWLPAETAGSTGRLHKRDRYCCRLNSVRKPEKVAVLNARGAALKPEQSVRAGKYAETAGISGIQITSSKYGYCPG